MDTTTPAKSSFFHVHNCFYLALYDEEQANTMAHHSLQLKYVVVPVVPMEDNVNEQDHSVGKDGVNAFLPASLIELYKFNEMVNQIARRNADHKLVFSAGRNLRLQIRAAFLIGSHMVMSHGFDAEKIYQIFKSFEEFFELAQIGILECWRALYRAKSSGWIDFQERFELEHDDDISIDMEEFVHYASPINGKIATLIPNQLVLFESPDDDTVSGAGATHFTDKDGHRSFSSIFYAELLAELGAALVISFDEVPAGADDASRAAFASVGIDYCGLEDLGGGYSSRLSLQTLDSFVSLVAGCPGLVAVHCRDDFHAGATGTCLAALLLRQRNFPTIADALAWMRMVCPSRHAQAVDLGLLECRRPDPCAWKLRRDRSMSLVARPVSGSVEGARLLVDLDAALASIEEEAAAAASTASTPFSGPCSALAQLNSSSPPSQSSLTLPASARPCSFGRLFSTSSPNLVALSCQKGDGSEF